MQIDSPNLVDWLTLVAATVGVLLSTWIAIWSKWREDREVFDIHIDWEYFSNGYVNEMPFVYVHNRSNSHIMIVSLNWLSGPMQRRESKNTAKNSEGPEDENFPYEIQSGSFSKFYLDCHGAQSALKTSERCANFFGFFRRSSLWLKVTTMRGKSKIISAERAMIWNDRPKWLTGE